MKYLLEAVTVIAVVITAGSFLLYDTPQPEWKNEIIANDTYGKFVEIDSYGENIGIVYLDSIDSGIRLMEKSYPDSVQELLLKTEQSWDKQVIDDDAEAGMYPSLESNNEELFISYQNGNLGDERLYFASRSNGDWSREEVDNVADGGVSVGMYSSFTFQNGEPVIFYHSPSQGLKVAEKQGKEWQKQQLEEDQGWYTETAKCNEKIIAAYRGRDSSKLKTGELGQQWSSEDTGIEMKSDLDIDTRNCEEHLIYLDEETEQITYRGPEQKREFGANFFARVSIVAGESIHLAYYDEGSGTVYAEKKQEEWNRTLVRESPEAGKYNDLTVRENGDIHLVYTDNKAVYHSFYNRGTAEKLKETTDRIRQGLSVISVFLIITLIWRKELVSGALNRL